MSSLTTLLLAPSLLLLQDPAPTAAPTAAPAAPRPLFELWIDDCSACLRSPKDAGLLAALSMLDDRLLELPGEFGGQLPPMPPGAIETLSHVLTGRKCLRVFENSDPNAPMPLFLQFEMQEPSSDAANAFAERVHALLADMGAPLGEPDAAGMRLLELPDGPPVSMGARGSAYVVSLGGSTSSLGAPTRVGLPDGVAPSMSMHLDLGRMTEMLTSFAPMSPGEAEEVSALFEAIGLSDMVVDANYGSDAQRSYGTVRMPGYAAIMRNLGIFPQRGLVASDFAMVPADAEWAQISTFDAEGLVDLVMQLLRQPMDEMGMEDPIAMMRDEIGIDLLADVVDHLGTSMALYTSKSTGGGGFFSTVAVVELTNAAGMRATMHHVASLIDEVGSTEADGYVRVRPWSSGDAELFTLAFPGLPVPLELTVALSSTAQPAGKLGLPRRGHHAAGRARRARADRRRRPRPDREHVVPRAVPVDPIGASAVTFVDTKQLAGRAYGITSMACSALANVVRSPHSLREAGSILPTYGSFVDGALASVVVARPEGDDYVEYSRADGSMLVNVSGMVGMLTSSPLAMLFMSGAASSFLTASRAPAFGGAPLAPLGYVDEEYDDSYYDDEEYDDEEYEEYEDEIEVEEPVVEDEPTPAPATGGGGGR
ncbi:MAG: hypothetical protein R3F34_04225 [Planctomycetota bacterium]